MSHLTQDVLNILLEADPQMDIHYEDDENKVIFDFTPETNTAVEVPCQLENSVDRAHEGIMALVHRLILFSTGKNRNVQTVGIYAGIRKILGRDLMIRLGSRIKREYPEIHLN